MRRIAATLAALLCLTFAVLLFSAGEGFALPPCKGLAFGDWYNCVGTYTYPGGEKYVGEFKNNKLHGQGTLTWSDGTKYVGEFRDNKRHGQGTFTFAEGNKYVGEFKDNKMHGQGTFTYPNGDKYVGEFRNNNLNGQGTYTYASGGVREGIWKDGELISSSQTTPDEAELFVTGNLVRDLRSGKSDVRVSQSSGGWTGIIQFWRKRKSVPDFKAIVTAQSTFYGVDGVFSAEAAVEGALTHCKESGGGRTRCEVYAVGDIIVQGHSQAELADVIEAYQLEVSGSKTTSKSRTSSRKAVYCKTNDGTVYVKYVYENSTGGCGGLNKKITQAEYDLKKTIYCKSVGFHNSYTGQKSDVTVYRRGGGLDCFYPHTQITKAEYDSLRDKKTDTADDTSSTTEVETEVPSDDAALEVKLEKLRKLLEGGLITEEEAAAKRAKLLEDL